MTYEALTRNPSIKKYYGHKRTSSDRISPYDLDSSFAVEMTRKMRETIKGPPRHRNISKNSNLYDLSNLINPTLKDSKLTEKVNED